MDWKVAFPLILLSVTSLVFSNDEFEQAFGELESSLKDSENVTGDIENLKEDLAKDPTNSTKILEIVKLINKGVRNFESANNEDVFSGMLNIGRGVSAYMQGKIESTALLSLLKKAIGTLTSRKLQKVMQEALNAVINQARDITLESKGLASVTELATAFGYILRKHKKRLDYHDVLRIRSNIKIDTGHDVINFLSRDISIRKTSVSPKDQKLCMKYSILLAKFAVARDLLLYDVIVQMNRADDPNAARSYQEVLRNFLINYKDFLGFLNAPEVAHIGVLTQYFPPEHSKKTRFLQDFLAVAGSNTVEMVEGKFLLISAKWPKYHVYLHSSGYLKLEKGYAQESSLIFFKKRVDGYWELKTENGIWLTINAKHPDYVWTTVSRSSNEENRNFIVIKFPKRNTIIICRRKTPIGFWKAASYSYYVHVREGFSGPDSQFYVG